MAEQLQDFCIISFNNSEGDYTEIEGKLSGKGNVQRQSLSWLLRNFYDMPDLTLLLYTENGKETMLMKQ